MKKIIVFFGMLLWLVTITGGGVRSIEFTDENKKNVPDCVVSIDMNGDYRLTIIANQDEIIDKEAFAKQLIEMVRDNKFKTMMFSYDVKGYPTGLQMNVYLSEEDWKNREMEPCMKISLRQENILNRYNIVEHYNKFELEIES